MYYKMIKLIVKNGKNHPFCEEKNLVGLTPAINLWSISPTFYMRICANILSPKEVQI
jgi:hypothetical protein